MEHVETAIVWLACFEKRFSIKEWNRFKFLQLHDYFGHFLEFNFTWLWFWIFLKKTIFYESISHALRHFRWLSLDKQLSDSFSFKLLLSLKWSENTNGNIVPEVPKLNSYRKEDTTYEMKLCLEPYHKIQIKNVTHFFI